MANLNGISAYQQANQSQANQAWNSNRSNKTKESKDVKKSDESQKTKSGENDANKISDNFKTKEWKPVDESSSLVPSVKEGYGFTIGDVSLSEKAKSYYDELKRKFGDASFILVSKDMKKQVQANAAAYGNKDKLVVLIDEEKLERMAEDESFRKKYEGIIAMSRAELQNMKNSLSSSGAGIKNFGMSVSEDGTTKYFATLEKANAATKDRIEKKQKENKEKKIKEKKIKEKKIKEKKQEEKKKAEKEKNEKTVKSDEISDDIETKNENKEYLTIETSSLEELVGNVYTYAYRNSANNIMTDQEKNIGQNFDSMG